MGTVGGIGCRILIEYHWVIRAFNPFCCTREIYSIFISTVLRKADGTTKCEGIKALLRANHFKCISTIRNLEYNEMKIIALLLVAYRFKKYIFTNSKVHINRAVFNSKICILTTRMATNLYELVNIERGK